MVVSRVVKSSLRPSKLLLGVLEARSVSPAVLNVVAPAALVVCAYELVMLLGLYELINYGYEALVLLFKLV